MAGSTMRDELQEELAAAFDDDLADAVDSFTCEKPIYSGEFDFETQTYPIVGDESYSGRGVLGNYLKDLVKPTDYQVEDAKAIVLQNELSQAPQIGDEWNFSHGKFKVINISKDPTDSIWTCQLRKV